MVAAFDLTLLDMEPTHAPRKHRQARPPAPQVQDCVVPSVHWLSPLDVRFTHTLPSTTNYIARAQIDETRTVGESINKVSNTVLPEARG